MSLSAVNAPPLAIRLFGPFEVRLHGDPLPRLRSRKVQWLLALLVLRAGSEVERAWLMGMLWPDSPEAAAMANLRSSLKDLRQALGAEAIRLGSPTPHSLALDLAGTDVDLLTFDRCVARGDPASLEEAAGLYRGPLLEGCAEPWAFQERQRREQAYLAARESLAARAVSAGDPIAAERHLRLAVAADPLQESAQRALMKALAAGGSYAAALLVYRELRLLLHRELNAEPDPETRALFEEIRSRAQKVAPRERVSGESPSPAVVEQRATFLEPVGGAVPLDSAFYVERSVDGEFLDALTRRDGIVLIKGARQMRVPARGAGG